MRKTWDEKSALTVPRKSMVIGNFFVYIAAHLTAAREKKRAVRMVNTVVTVFSAGISPVSQ